MDSSTIIEGTVKFRDGKKWKSRWCVMRKLSPVADCVHLQLYRDSRDRYKQGQTKASLSLQHFLGLETGFTLDKESNTMAIICQDVTVVLAFDTRERLIQWQVKIANNLGEDQQFLIQIISVPPRVKISTGPAHLHVQEYRFSLTAGVPPRLLGCWEISQLRRYGAVEKRFCFEGGSRCGKGEGVYVLATDQSEDISRTLDLAAQGKLMTRRRPVTRNMSVMESPRHSSRHARSESVQDNCACSPFPSMWTTPSESLPWPSNESQADTSCDFGDSSSMEFSETQSQGWQSERGIGRCVSCISKLGGQLSRSSTVNPPVDCRSSSGVPPSSMSVSSCDSGGSSEYSTPRLPSNSDTWFTPSLTSDKCSCCPPARPPKPSKLSHQPVTVSKKPPMALPHVCPCQHNHNAFNNYDVPRSIATASFKDENRLSINSSSDEYYDTPRSIRDSLQRTPGGSYPMPVFPHCPRHIARCSLPCPCQRLMCCPESWLFSYAHCCSPEPIQSVPVQKVRLSGTGKMPVNTNGNIAIYATVDKLKKLKCKEDSESISKKLPDPPEENDHVNSVNQPSAKLTDSANYVNVDPCNEKSRDSNTSKYMNSEKCLVGFDKTENCTELNYTNLEFAHSLQYYENARDILQRTGLTEDDINDDKFCSKCGHTSNNIQSSNDSNKNGDYLLMEPAVSEVNSSSHLKSVECNEELHQNHKKYNINHESVSLAEKCSSAPSLAGAKLELWQKQNVSDFSRLPGKSAPRINQSLSAASSPYLRRHLMSCCSREDSFHCRRRSTSAESSKQSESTENDNKSVVYTSQSIYDTETSHPSVNSASSHPVELHITEEISQLDTSENIVNKKTIINKTVHINTADISDGQDSVSSIVNIRRSSSVPCKSGNRDSSSSNDSGVSTGSLNQRGTDFAEFELPLSGKRHYLEGAEKINSSQCLHNSLPRKSKSTDPLQELTFQFQKDGSPKSSSAEAEVPVCPIKRNLFKGCTSPDRNMLCPGLIDSRSNSSGTSDMSDYCETLSLSSYCSDTTDCLRFSHHPAATTMRPRSGKEYQKIDRFILENDSKVTVHSSGNESNAEK